jgi:MerR family transcriptional regulator, light-induced transcriptional regulator
VEGHPDVSTGESGDELRLTVAVVARRLGIAPATLRTWDRRYGLGPGEHAAGEHRRYRPADLDRLHTMRRLTLEGVPPGEAARAALAGSAPVAEVPERTTLPDRSGLVRTRGPVLDRPAAVPGAEATVRGLGRAALALDSSTVTGTVRAELARHGVVATWEQVLVPVLAAAGARWAATGEGIEVEHLLSDCLVAALREVSATGVEPAGRPVLLACAPDEQHVLALHAVAAGLAERGLGARVLGPAMPAAALTAAVRRTGPAALFLWSQLPGTADPAVLDALPVTRPPTSLVVGGPGWQGGRLPARVALARRLPEALDLVGAAVGT